MNETTPEKLKQMEAGPDLLEVRHAKLETAARRLNNALLEKARLECRAIKDRFKGWQSYTKAWEKAYRELEAARQALSALLS